MRRLRPNGAVTGQPGCPDRRTHDYPITLPQAQRLGLPARKDLPAEVYGLMELYPQPHQARPSVQFVPAPYGREPESWAPRSGR
jgi:hypothetical protein